MSKDIWHTTDEAPKSCVYIAFYVDGYLYSGCYEPQYNQYGIFGADKVEKWCYIKELSPYILALEAELERTRKTLEQSEICCTEWEKEALDYKAENIALSGDLERTRKALEIAWDALIYDGTSASKNALDKIKALTDLNKGTFCRRQQNDKQRDVK